MFGESLAKCIYNYPFLKLILQHTLQGWDDEEKKSQVLINQVLYSTVKYFSKLFRNWWLVAWEPCQNRDLNECRESKKVSKNDKA